MKNENETKMKLDFSALPVRVDCFHLIEKKKKLAGTKRNAETHSSSLLLIDGPTLSQVSN